MFPVTLKSTRISTLSDQSSIWIAKDLRFLQPNSKASDQLCTDARTDLSLHWLHMSKDTWSHACGSFILKSTGLRQAKKAPSNKYKMRGFRSSCAIAMCHLGLCSPFIHSGPSCSKLMMSLVNDSLKFTSSDTQICCNFLLKKCE